jgi:uncharacterized membrane protein HdeD (DUF308 family)
MLSKLLSHYWWVLLLRGAIAILFGITALTYPGMTIATLVLYFAAFALLDGVSNVFHAFTAHGENESWWALLLEGLLSIAFAVITFQAPAMTTLMLLLYIGFWAISTGALRIVLAVRLRHEIDGEWWMALGGLASIFFGMAMIARPGAGALALLTVIGFWSIVNGVSLVFIAFKVKAVGGKVESLKKKLAPA